MHSLLKSGVDLVGIFRKLLNIHGAFSGDHIQRLRLKFRFVLGEPKTASALNICVGVFGPLLNQY